jgi:hypothetical protein
MKIKKNLAMCCSFLLILGSSYSFAGQEDSSMSSCELPMEGEKPKILNPSEKRSLNEIGYNVRNLVFDFLDYQTCHRVCAIDSLFRKSSVETIKTNQSVEIDCNNNTKIRLTGLDLLQKIYHSSPNIKNLKLTDCNITDEGAQFIASHFPLLVSLSLRNCSRMGVQIGLPGVIAIVTSEQMKGLKSLSLDRNDIRTAGAAVIARSPYMQGLKTLSFVGNNIDNDGAASIAQSEFMKGLTTLNLSSNYIGSEGASLIAGSPYMKGLTSLDLGGNQIGTIGAQSIARSNFMKALTSLGLRGNSITEEGAQAIAQSEYMQELRTLDMNWNTIGDVGAQAIARSEYMKGLIKLNLISNTVGSAGAIEIAGSEYMKSLTTLNLLGNPIGSAASEAIRKQFPFVFISDF